MGRLWRQQGRPPASEPHLRCRAGRRRGASACPRPGRYGYRAARDRAAGFRSHEPEAPRNRRPRTGRRDCRGAPEQRSARHLPGLRPGVKTMIPESRPLQRPPETRLLVIDAAGRMRQVPRADFVTMLRRGDLAIANDAATLPASLHGNHVTTGAAIELRLAGWPSAILDDPRRFHAIVFGAGDYRQRNEDRSPPPLLQPGDRLALGPLSARIEALLGHPSSRSTSRGRGTRSGPAWHATAGRFSTRMYRRRSPSGTCGRRSPVRPSPSSRLPPALRSTGGALARCAPAALSSRRSPMPPASPRPATRRSTISSLSTSLTRSPRRPPRRSARREPTAAV